MARLTSLFMALPLIGLAYPSFAQPIIPANDRTNTIVNTQGDRIDITGGQLSGDRTNLFHSFQQFGLSSNQIANFLATPNIQNILGRVIGGDASIINGLIQVTGSNANLFLMNPAGIIFGNNASLNIGGAFTATTANGIGFGNNFFSAIGNNNYAALVGNPNSFAFTMSQPGGIVSAADLAVNSGKDINFLGGTVVSTGTLSAPDGRITLAAVAGENLVRLSQTGDVMGLEFQPNPSLGINPWGLSILTLPQLLTGANLERATGITVNPNGDVILTAANLPIKAGDTVVGNINAGSANLVGDRNLTLANSKLQTSKDLNLYAKDTITARDSINTPFIANAGANLTFQGNNGIDIFTLNNAASGLFSGGSMTLRSANPVSGDTKYTAGGNFRIEKLDGSLGSLISLFDPVINTPNDVSLASFFGPSLVIISGGKVTIPGDITITSPDTSAFVSGNVPLSDGTSVSVNSSTRPTLQITAGTASTIPTSTTTNDINIGNVIISAPNGNVVISTFNPFIPRASQPQGNISIGNITTTSSTGGDVIVDSRGTAKIGNIATNTNEGFSSGNVKVLAQNDITTGTIDTSGFPNASNPSPPSNINAGSITLTSTAGAVTTNALSANSAGGVAGAINVTASRDITIGSGLGDVSASIFLQGNGNGGNITFTSSLGAIFTRSVLTDTTRSVLTNIGGNGNGGNVTFTALNGILIGNVSTRTTGEGNAGNITFNSSSGFINTSGLFASSTVGNGGNILLNARDAISSGVINTTGGDINGIGGNIAASSQLGTVFLIGILASGVRGGGDVNIFAGIDVIVNDGNGAIDTSSQLFVNSGSAVTGRGGDVDIFALGNINVGEVNTSSFASSLAATGTNGSLSSVGSNDGGNVKLNAAGSVTVTGSVSTNSGAFVSGNFDGNSSNFGGNITILAGTNVDVSGSLFSAAIQRGGDITVSAEGNIFIGGDINSRGEAGFTGIDTIVEGGGNVNLGSGQGNITVGGAISSDSLATSLADGATSGDGGDITITASGTLGSVAIAGGITTSSNATGETSAKSANGGTINVLTPGNIEVGFLNTFSSAFTSSSFLIPTTDNGGSVTLDGKSIAVSGNILTTSTNGNGGDVTLLAINTISTLAINTSSVFGNGGNVFIDPSGLTKVSTINAQGGISGGEISINFESLDPGLFQAFGTFTALDGTNASISNQGGSSSQPITIVRGGGTSIPFTVGSPAPINGTSGVITNGSSNTISSGVFPFTFTQGSPLISIISSAATSTPISELPRTFDENRSRPPIEEKTNNISDVPESEATLPTNLAQTATQSILEDIGRETGKKPAIITVRFTPEGDRLVLILSTAKGKIVKSLPITRKQVLDQADSLSLEVATIPLGRNNPQDYLQPAQKLYQWLVAPWDSELEQQGIDTVLFEMPDGLRDRPVSAFHDGRKFLVEKYSTGLIPSLNLVDNRYRNLRNVQALVMGASEFINPNLKPLLAVPLEVKAVSDNWNSVAFLNQNFNLNNLTSQRNQTPFGIIHLATHAEFISGGDSYIQLWGDEKLRPQQIRNLGWRDVELLVLSACKTATGDRTDELGFAGLAAQSGVKSILASLWQVSDEGTLSLMSEFYKQMSRPEISIKAEGLRQAQLSMLNRELVLSNSTIRSVRGTSISLPATLPVNRDLSHPFYWAAFTMIGSPW